MSYIANSMDYHMTNEEYDAYLEDMSSPDGMPACLYCEYSDECPEHPEEYNAYHSDAYESFMKETFMCPLCECTHWSINGKKHQQCQMPEGY